MNIDKLNNDKEVDHILGGGMESPTDPEFGGEILEQLETSAAEALKKAERKDNPSSGRGQTQGGAVTATTTTTVTDDAGNKKKSDDIPKYFGYQIPPGLMRSVSNQNNGSQKMEPSVSRSWVRVLLKKMLKMRS